jgi:hypothetical protein
MRAQEVLPIIIRTNDGIQQRLTIHDVNISCFYPQGSGGVSCNSQFILETMLTIDAQIHQQMPWIP